MPKLKLETGDVLTIEKPTPNFGVELVEVTVLGPSDKHFRCIDEAGTWHYISRRTWQWEFDVPPCQQFMF